MNDSVKSDFDCLLLVSFGGPEKREDVIPFLENVLRGKNVPRARMEEVAEHYYHFDGRSPINAQVRELAEALKADFQANQLELPIYIGNRNWHPMLADTLTTMGQEGRKKALAFFTSTYSCYSGCRQYRENIADAQEQVGDTAPEVHKLRMCFNHPLFVEAATERVREAFAALSSVEPGNTRILFTAHSIPEAMARNCDYELQLKETSRLIAASFPEIPWELVFQSRSGPPHQPWLEPDICDRIEELHAEGVRSLVLMPVGFLSDHMEVLFDLDIEARDVCKRLGVDMARARTVGTHPKFIAMIRELVLERTGNGPRRSIGELPCWHDVCPTDCCLSGRPMASG